jgi:hypothetical protein
VLEGATDRDLALGTFKLIAGHQLDDNLFAALLGPIDEAFASLDLGPKDYPLGEDFAQLIVSKH